MNLNLWYSNDFGGNKTWLIHLNSPNNTQNNNKRRSIIRTFVILYFKS